MSEQRYIRIASNIREALEKKERSISWLARKCGTSQAMMSYVVSGQRSAGADLARRIADTLDMPLFLIFELTDVREIATSVEMSA